MPHSWSGLQGVHKWCNFHPSHIFASPQNRKVVLFLCSCLSFSIFVVFVFLMLSGQTPALNVTVPVLCPKTNHFHLICHILHTHCHIQCFQMYFGFSLSLHGFLLILHPTSQPGSDPMTVPVPVPMVLFPHKVRWIYHYLFSPVLSGGRKQTGDRKVQLQCLQSHGERSCRFSYQASLCCLFHYRRCYEQQGSREAEVSLNDQCAMKKVSAVSP